MVFQQYALYPHLTIRENLAFGLKMRNESAQVIQTRIQEVTELLEIHQLLDRRPKELSGGQRQRVAMGGAIVRKPKLFLFDEPLSNLDARLRASMRVELKKLHQQLGVTMIYVTHDQVEAMTLGEKIVIMDQGAICQVGVPHHIYHKPATPFVAGFIGNPPMNLLNGKLEHAGGISRFQAGKLVLDLPAFDHSMPQPQATSVLLGIRPEDVHIQGLSNDSPSPSSSTSPESVDVRARGSIEKTAGDHVY